MSDLVSPAPVASVGIDALARLGAAGIAGAGSAARRHSVNRRRQFSLLIVRGDGVRVMRFNFSRPLATSVLVGLAVTVSAVGALTTDYISLRNLTREAVTFQAQINEQKATIEGFNRRIAELRQEMTGWRQVHARIWEPFGPELAPGSRDKGMGGAVSPDRAPARLEPGDELRRLAETVAEEGESLRALDRLMSRAGKALAAMPSRWPVRGGVNSEFGHRQSPWTTEREFHSGLDIKASMGTPVRAPAAGSVTHAGPAHEYGTTIILDHGQEIKTLYGHLSVLHVKPGQQVARGAVIGLSGNTGRSSGPHLHYEIFVKGQPVNPRAYIWE